MAKSPPAIAGDVRDLGSIPGLGRSPGGGHGNPLQCSCLENPMDRGAWWATVHRVARSQTRLSDLAHMDPLQCETGLYLGLTQSCWKWNFQAHKSIHRGTSYHSSISVPNHLSLRGALDSVLQRSVEAYPSEEPSFQDQYHLYQRKLVLRVSKWVGAQTSQDRQKYQSYFYNSVIKLMPSLTQEAKLTSLFLREKLHEMYFQLLGFYSSKFH